MVETVVAPVKSAWASKVNWVGGLTALGALLSELLPFAPPPYDHYITVAIAVVGGIATVITKTFYTTAITPSSAAKMGPTQ